MKNCLLYVVIGLVAVGMLIWGLLKALLSLFRLILDLPLIPCRWLMLRAVRDNRPWLLRWLLALRLNPNFTLDGQMPLKTAVERRDEALTTMLLAHGAEPNFLSTAALKGNLELAELLLQHGARPDDPSDYVGYFTYPENPIESFAAGPLFIAVANRNYPLIQLLLAHGADPDQQVAGKDIDHPSPPPVMRSTWELAHSLGDEQIIVWLNEAKEQRQSGDKIHRFDKKAR